MILLNFAHPLTEGHLQPDGVFPPMLPDAADGGGHTLARGR